MKEKICCFLGQEYVDGIFIDITYKKIKSVIQKGINTFYVGHSGCFDKIAKWGVLKAKEEYPHIKIFLILSYIPDKGEDFTFENFDGILYTGGLSYEVNYHKRVETNKWMVDKSEVIIAFIEKTYGTEYMTMQYGKNKKKQVINLGVKKEKFI